MTTKILKVSKIHKAPAAHPGAPHMLTTRRRTQRDTWSCAFCKTEHTATTRWYLHRGTSRGARATRKSLLCAKCAERVFLCPSCGTWKLRVAGAEPHLVSLRVGSAASQKVAVCRSCVTKHFYTCCRCQTEYVKDPALVDGDSCYCAKCVADFMTCGGCGKQTPPTTLQEIGVHKVCSTCVTEYTPNTEGHSSKPPPHFHTTRTPTPYLHTARVGELYMGVELEIDDGKRARSLCRDLSTYPHLYLKRDGSLSALGIEVVSHPGTLVAHKNNFDWSAILGHCRRHEYKSYDASHSCGIHVHVNRSFLDYRYNDKKKLDSLSDKTTSVNLMKLMCFVYGHTPQFKALAQRESKEYAAFTSVSSARDVGPRSALHTCTRLKKTGDLRRYSALNFSNEHTVEWRIFKGTLVESTFMAYLELVDASCRFAVQSGVSLLMDNKRSWYEFCRYIEANDKQYTWLREYMKGKDVWKA